MLNPISSKPMTLVERSARFVLVLALLVVAPSGLSGQGASVSGVRVADGPEEVVATLPAYTLRIGKEGFRFRIERPDGTPFAAAHPGSGLQLSPAGEPLADATATELLGSTYDALNLRVTTQSGVPSRVTVKFSASELRFSVRPEKAGSYDIVLRTAGMAPAYGLGDHAAFPYMQADEEVGFDREGPEIVEYVNEGFRGGNPGIGDTRMISNFVVYPRHEVALVNIDPGIKVVRVTREESAQGSRGVRELPALHYFVGDPKTIYRAFRDARDRSGFPVLKPKYDFFGVGWEAWGALAWDTSERTVRENVERYLELGYPLRWMVVGSGFWPRQDSILHATTSFGMWDPNLYPDPVGFIDHFHRLGLKFVIGLRIAFITEGPFAAEGLAAGHFITENGQPKVFEIGFPLRPVYLLDATHPGAVDWYLGLVQKWVDYGVDGFKEDLYGYGRYDLRDDKVDAINRLLMDRGLMVMARNAYLGSAADIHRFNDFNFNQTQDRGPINGLAFAYSGFPNVYPDIVGGTLAASETYVSSEAARAPERVRAMYLMRYAQYASVNPSMSVGYGPWNFADPKVNQVVLEAARLHDRLHPYIYSAAIDAYRTGFPYPLTPLPLAYPDDPEVYGLADTSRRSYQWLIGESLLATPLYGDDYATADTRDVYLPEGVWIDYDTGERYEGPRTLDDFPLPLGKTPLFVGGRGIVVEQRDGVLEAHLYPVKTQTSLRFHHADGGETSIAVNLGSWDNPVAVRTTAGEVVPFRRDRGRIVFPIRSGTDYLVLGEWAGAARSSVRR